MKKIGILTSGGDAPGINASIRAAVRISHSKKFETVGFERGWEGLINNEVRPLTPRSVGGIIHLGGTILRTSRCPEFRTKRGIKIASEILDLNNIDALLVIGGDGTFRGAHELSKWTNTLIVGIPASIDNDVFGTEETIGFDTAVNTAVNEIDKIRDTAISHERVFITEVMGRKRGFLAATIGLTVGAEVILIPERTNQIDELCEIIKKSAKVKKSGIIVAAEGVGNTHKLAQEIEKRTGVEVKLSIIGYSQRGGSPSSRSRLLACLFAEKAIKLIERKMENRIVGLRRGAITSIPIQETVHNRKPLNVNLLKLASILAI